MPDLLGPGTAHFATRSEVPTVPAKVPPKSSWLTPPAMREAATYVRGELLAAQAEVGVRLQILESNAAPASPSRLGALAAEAQRLRCELREVTARPARVRLTRNQLGRLGPGYGTWAVESRDRRMRVGELTSQDVDRLLCEVKDPEIRRAVWEANIQRGLPEGAAILKRLVAVSQELAEAAGERSVSHAFVDLDLYQTGLDKQRSALGPAVKREQLLLLRQKQREEPGATELHPWDFRRATVLHAEAIGVGGKLDFALAPYFEAAQVQRRVFDLLKPFGFEFQPIENAGAWGPKVEAFKVHFRGQSVGAVCLDVHSGPPKGDGAWAVRIPAADGLPCRVAVLGNCYEESGIAPAKTGADFAEVPSLFFESWGELPEVVAALGRHQTTGARLPFELLQGVLKQHAHLRAHDTAETACIAEYGLRLFANQELSSDPRALYQESRERWLGEQVHPNDHQYLLNRTLNHFGPQARMYLDCRIRAHMVLEAFRPNPLDAKVAERFVAALFLSDNPDGPDRAAEFAGGYSHQPFVDWVLEPGKPGRAAI